MDMKQIQTAFLATLMVAALGLQTSTQTFARDAETTETIKITAINSADTDVAVYIYGHVLKQAGYNVKFVSADYTASLTGLRKGDLHVGLCWDTTWEACNKVIQTGDVLNIGSTGIEIREGWWYPNFIKEQCPGLPDWKALQMRKLY